MNKVICELCGTSYPDSASQCPICGCVRSKDAPVIHTPEPEKVQERTQVKGGRFSKSNVRKRNQKPDTAQKKEKKASISKNSQGLIIVLVCLILVVAAMIVYVLIGWNISGSNPSHNPPQTTQQEIPCTGLTLSKNVINLTNAGEAWKLEATPIPANTTDAIVYASSDETVATVSASGKVTYVGAGTADITVMCGQQTASCRVNCEAVPETTQQPTIPPESISLNRKSIVANFEGYTWILYSGNIPMEDIVWRTDDQKVATVKNGVVTAVGEGTTTVYADYNGLTSSCMITCDFTNKDKQDGSGEKPIASDGQYKIATYWDIGYDEEMSRYDVTLAIGESVELFLKSKATGQIQENVVRTLLEGADYVTIDGSTITVTSSVGNAKVQAEYNGTTYICYIRTTN